MRRNAARLRDAYHALTCSKHGGVRMLCRNHLNKVWCDAARCGRVTSGEEHTLHEMQVKPGIRRHRGAREDARDDALLAIPEGMLAMDVNIVHSLAATYLQGTPATWTSAQVDGAAVAMGEHSKDEECSRDIDGGSLSANGIFGQSCKYRLVQAHGDQQASGAWLFTFRALQLF